jgi:outer membrane PBP1 activator LpoA protein
MSDHRIRLQPLLLAALFSSLLFGCAPAPKKVAPKPKPPSAETLLLNNAVAREASGDFNAAAALFADLARRSPAPQREQFWVRAANAYLQADDDSNASAALARAERTLLNPEMAFLALLIDAELALGAGHLEAAQTSLEPPPLSASRSALSRYRQLRAQWLRRRGNFLDSARERAVLDTLLSDYSQRLDNQTMLLRTLSAMSDEDLLMLRPSPPDNFGAWMELALLLRAYAEDAPRARSEFSQWRVKHPQHPALPELITAYQAKLARLRVEYAHIAVLLPTTGRYAKASLALQDGLMSAYYATAPERRPRLKFYDTSHTDDTWPLLQQAIAEGAEAAIGPLQKEAVQQLAEAGELAIPVLTLNRIKLERAPPSHLFQFGLAPEDEARQAARQAWKDGATGAIVLLPNSDWGQRLSESFRQQWESLGGTLAAQQVYDPELNDFSEQIRSLLKLDASQQREQALTRELRQSLEFQPRRRQDADALFLIANAAKARALWPQLQFHRAGDLPTYATSQIYDGKLSMPQDLDLVGLMFTDIPWLLQPGSEAAALPPEMLQREGLLARLFALGMDSYRLLAELPRLKEFPSSTYPGNTGNLSLDTLNQVHRELMWARISANGLELLGQPPAANAEAPEPDSAPPTPTQTTPDETPPTQAGHVSPR